MLRETTLEGQSELYLSSLAVTKNVEELEKIKKEHGLKVYLKLNPLFDYINNNKLSVDDNNKLIASIMNNVYIYYYINHEVIILILNNTRVDQLSTLYQNVVNDKIPKKLIISNPTYDHLSTTLKKIYDLRYKSLLLRYISFLQNVFV
jgi:hypothetical protein